MFGGGDSDNIVNADIDCRKYSINNFKSSFSVSDKFVVFHQNIRSYNKNSDEFILFMSSLDTDVDVVILSETWFDEYNLHDICGFKAYHTYRKDRTGGGVSVFVNNRLSSKIIPNMSFVTPICEFCSVNVRLSAPETINIVGFYRSPNRSTVEEFCELFRDGILSHFSSAQLILTGGDANINLASDDRLSDCYMDLMYSYSLLPYITLPTRISANSQTIIDHIWCNVVSNVRAGVVETDITDHFTIFACLLDRKAHSNLICRKFRDCSGN